MKYLLATLLLLATVLSLSAQAPQMLNYQGVARNPSGTPISNQTIKIRLSIQPANGTPFYVETHTVSTNLLGLYALQIGQGSVVSGNFSAISWAQNTAFLQVEIDPSGGNNFIQAGAPTQLISVPYALEAQHAASATMGGDVTGTSGSNTVTHLQSRPIGSAAPAVGDVLKWNGSLWQPGTDATSGGNALSAGNGIQISGSTITNTGDLDEYNELQSISLNGNTLTLSDGGGSVTLPTGGGNTLSAGNGIQISGNTITNTGDLDEYNELQSISLNGNTLTLSDGGGSVTLPTGGGVFTLPYQGATSSNNDAFAITNNSNVASAISATNSLSGFTTYLGTVGNAAFMNGPVWMQNSTSSPELVLYSTSAAGPKIVLYEAANNGGIWAINASNETLKLMNTLDRGLILDGYGAGSCAFKQSSVYIGLPGDITELELLSDNADGYGSLMIHPVGAPNHSGLKANSSILILETGGQNSVDIPIANNTFEPYSDYQLDLGRSVYRWNTVYAAATNLSSDRRLKEQINPIKYGLQTVMQMRPVDYFWKDKKISAAQQYGFIAQELETVLPEVVTHDILSTEELESLKKTGKPVPEITDPYGINYTAITPVLVKAMQEQQALIEQLQAQNTLLAKRIEALEKK